MSKHSGIGLYVRERTVRVLSEDLAEARRRLRRTCLRLHSLSCVVYPSAIPPFVRLEVIVPETTGV